MRKIKTILPICLVGVMAPTISIFATSCTNGATPNKDYIYSFNNGEPISITWNDVYQNGRLPYIDPNYPTPAEYAQNFVNDYGLKYSGVTGEISQSDDKSILSYIVDSKLIDANVLAYLIVMDAYQFVWSLHYNKKSASYLYNPKYLWSDELDTYVNVHEIHQVTLDIYEITSHYNEKTGYTYDINWEISTNVTDVNYSTIYSTDDSCFWGFSLAYGHHNWDRITLDVQNSKEVMESEYGHDMIRMIHPDTIYVENPSQITYLYWFLNNACGHNVPNDPECIYLSAADLVNIVYPNIKIK